MISPARRLDRYLEGCVSAGLFPGCVAWIGDLKQVRYHQAFGYAQIVPAKRRMHLDTIFDLASLTKPLATAMLVMRMTAARTVRLSEPVARFLPQFRNTRGGSRTIGQLLNHTAGMIPWYPLYLLDEAGRDRLLALPGPSTHVRYSCLGYTLLHRIVEVVSGDAFDRAFAQDIALPLGLPGIRFRPSLRTARVAATELGNTYERKKARGYRGTRHVPWRYDVIRAQVHDGNAFYAYAGVAGNAGLFASAADTAELVRAMLRGELLSPRHLTEMLRDRTPHHEGWGMGWDLRPYPRQWPQADFGHTGFTGTMLAARRRPALIMILFANSVHPHVRTGVMRPVRREFVGLARGLADGQWSKTSNA